MEKKKVVAVFQYLFEWGKEITENVAPEEFEVRFIDFNNDEEVRSNLPDADFVMTCTLKEEYVSLLNNCKLIQHQGVGHDGIALEALKKEGIPFAVTPEGTVNGVAEHTILLILALSKQLIKANQHVKNGNFDSREFRPNCHFLGGRTLGIVGFGRIGQRAAHFANAFEARIIYNDLFRASLDIEKNLNSEFKSFDELLSEADIVSVHTPFTPETELQFDAEAFSKMKQGSYFVNTGRGQTYDMDALYEALISGHIAGAGLDVFNPEPPPADHPILQLPNVICTPHMATGTVEAHLAKANAQFDNFKRVLNGEKPINTI